MSWIVAMPIIVFFAPFWTLDRSFIARVKDNTAFTLTEERTLNEAARAAGVTRDLVIGKLGTPHHPDFIEQPLRLVVVDATSPDGSAYTLWLVTDRLDLPAEMVALAYRYRWTIELFFRWFKCVLVLPPSRE